MVFIELNRNVNLNEVLVRIGSTDKLRGDPSPVRNVIIHPEYLKNGYIINDIALIELKSRVHFNTSFANRVCTSDDNEPIDRPELTIFAGWGQTSIDGYNPTNLLKKTTYSTTPPKMCKYKTNYFVCVNATQGMGCAVSLKNSFNTMYYY